MRRQLMRRPLGDNLPAIPEGTCAVSFWDYIVPAAIGGGAGLLSGFGARYLFRNEAARTADAAAHIVEGTVGLLVGGMIFILWNRRPH